MSPACPSTSSITAKNRNPCFFEDRDRHVHLLVTGRAPESMPRFMQVLNLRYSRFVNKAHDRTRTLYEGRYRSVIIETERGSFPVMRYIELNPVRAGMVAAPGQYRSSRYRGSLK